MTPGDYQHQLITRVAAEFEAGPAAPSAHDPEVGSALFDLANETNQIAAVEADLKSIKAARAESKDLRTLIASPAFTAEDKGKAQMGNVLRLAFPRASIGTHSLAPLDDRFRFTDTKVAVAANTISFPAGQGGREGVSIQALSSGGLSLRNDR